MTCSHRADVALEFFDDAVAESGEILFSPAIVASLDARPGAMKRQEPSCRQIGNFHPHSLMLEYFPTGGSDDDHRGAPPARQEIPVLNRLFWRDSVARKAAIGMGWCLIASA
jgi:hypothetical protein